MNLRGLVAPRLVTKKEDRRGDPRVVKLNRQYFRDYYRKNKKRIYAAYYKRAAKNPRKYLRMKNLYSRRWAQKVASDPELLKKLLWKRAMRRAAAYKIKFTVSLDDFMLPKRCPVFGTLLVSNLGSGLGRGAQSANPNAPALDRIIPSKGYVKGNVAVISQRANVLKRDASLVELKKLVRWLGRVTP